MGAPERSTRTYQSERRTAQSRLTRTRVLDAARTVFLAHGYAGATTKLIAGQAGVSVPTVEALFGTKARVLKAAIDVSIAGDDEPVPVLDRVWTGEVEAAATRTEVAAIVARVLAAAQSRSAGLVSAAFEGSSTNPELAELAEQLVAQRRRTAAWIVEAMAAKPPADATVPADAVDSLWILMEPAVFVRLTRDRHWTTDQYQSWLTSALPRLLVATEP